jgi:hypothetical protein
MENLLFGAVMLVTIVGPPAATTDAGLSLNNSQTGSPGRRDMGDHPLPPRVTRIRQSDTAASTAPKKPAR